ncbi:MAG TPA: hypothetical protein VGA95_07180 [Thermodesulfobacteriota bacterium]|jgi:hypothetical protein
MEKLSILVRNILRILGNKNEGKYNQIYIKVALLTSVLILDTSSCGSYNNNGEFNINNEVNSETPSSAFYISPTGSDSNPGTSDRPWKTFSFAIPKLQPGVTLVLKTGTYTKTTTGLPYVNCASNAKNGSAGSPITVKAENERQAFLSSDGSVEALRMENCSYWNIEGLRLEGNDTPTTKQVPTGWILHNDNIKIKRLLVAKHNRYSVNAALFAISKSDTILVEDSEFYYAIRHLLNCFQSRRCTFRRLYANARGFEPIPGGSKDVGDVSVVFYGTSNSIMENVIVEGNHENPNCIACGSQGMQIHSTAQNNMIIGSIAINTNINGYRLDSRNVSDRLVTDTIIENVVSYSNYDRGGFGGYLQQGAVNTQMKNVSIIDATGVPTARGLSLDGRCAACANGQPSNTSFHGENILSVGGTPAFQGFSVSSPWPILGGWDMEYTNAYNWHTNYSPATSHAYGSFSNKQSINPQLGNCIVFIPDSSPMKGVGKNGEDIGANIVYRYEDGILTDQKLWNQTTGQFPCGATVKGVNDDLNFPDSSCTNVHERLNVGVNGCAIP